MSKGGRNTNPDKKLDSRADSRKIKRLKAYPKLYMFPFKKDKKPASLSKPAAEYWDMIVPILADLAIICELDRPMLCVLCETWATWADSMRKINSSRYGFLEVTPDGCVTTSPLLGVTENLEKRLIGILKEFGMAPGYRTKIEQIPGIKASEIDVDKPPADTKVLSEWDEFLS